MRPIIILSFLVIFLIISCRPGIEKTETSPEALILILADVHFAEGALLSARLSDRDSLRKLYYGQVFEIHGISETVFERDMNILKYNPIMLEQIYEKVLEEINERESKLKKEVPETKK